MPTEKKTIFHQLDQLKKLQIQSKLPSFELSLKNQN